MAGLSIWVITWILGIAVFVPLLVIALVRLPSVKLAFAAAAAFSIGAMLGFFLSVSLAVWLHLRDAWNGVALLVFASAGAIGGAALGLALLRKFAGNQNWRR